MYKKIIDKIEKIDSPTQAEIAKILSKNNVSKSQLIQFIRKSDIKNKQKLVSLLKKKKVRTISGVTVVTVLTKPYKCPGNCIFCPDDAKMPKSYLSDEPGAQRAAANKFDPYLQVFNRLLALNNIGHPTDKVELIILGGTWSCYPKNYQRWFVKRCFQALNTFVPHDYPERAISTVPEAKTLWKEVYKVHQINQKASSRCVGLVFETRPDFINSEEAIRMRKLGATKVQIGIQSLDDDVLKKNKRGHTVKRSIEAVNLLRQHGFKIHAHWMPNLYGSTPKKDIEDYKKLFKLIKPDELKIYPCSLIKDTELMGLYKSKKWHPYTLEELTTVLKKCFMLTPRYCRITRVVRDISSDDIVAGNKKSNLRQIVEKELVKEGKKPLDIRFREIRGTKVDFKDLELKETLYETLGSKEVFLEYITQDDQIAGFLRLSRGDNAIIREVHVYGQSLQIGKDSGNKAQHMGLGKNLIQRAISLAKEAGFDKLAVISGIGTREYYRKLGFSQHALYQIKGI